MPSGAGRLRVPRTSRSVLHASRDLAVNLGPRTSRDLAVNYDASDTSVTRSDTLHRLVRTSRR